MADRYRYYRKTMIETVGKQWVDVTLAALVRYHAATTEDQADLLKLLSTDIKKNQLALILPRWGTRQPLQAETIDISRYGDGEFDQPPTLTASITFGNGPM